MENELIFNGQTYISSLRAAKLVGYTKDYVGQLCRSGKIEARFVGRTWYVQEDAIRRHKLGVHYTRHQKIADPNYAGSTLKKPATESSLLRDSFSNIPIRAVHAKDGERSSSAYRTAEAATVSRVRKVALEAEQAERKRARAYRALSESDISYETGEAVFYEDDRPVLPKPIKVTEFKGVPIVLGSKKPTEQHHGNVRVQAEQPRKLSRALRTHSNVHAHGGSVDGVTSPARAQNTASNKPYRDRTGTIQTSPRPTTRRYRDYEERPKKGSKAIPVYGALLIVLISAFAWIVALIVGMT